MSTIETVKPLEETDPELAAFFMNVAQGQKPYGIGRVYNEFLIPAQVETRKEGQRVKRNDPCPCGSGKKYKKCCGRG